MSAPELKPCPFCGAAPDLVQPCPSGWAVQCNGCGVATGLRYSLMEDARPLIVEEWNRRAGLAPGIPGFTREEVRTVAEYLADWPDFRVVDVQTLAAAAAMLRAANAEIARLRAREADAERMAAALRSKASHHFPGCQLRDWPRIAHISVSDLRCSCGQDDARAALAAWDASREGGR